MRKDIFYITETLNDLCNQYAFNDNYIDIENEYSIIMK